MVVAIDYATLLTTATEMIEGLAGNRAAWLRAIDGGAVTPVTALPMANQGQPERDGRLMGNIERDEIIAAKPGVAPDPELHQLLVDGETLRIVCVRALKPSTTT